MLFNLEKVLLNEYAFKFKVLTMFNVMQRGNLPDFPETVENYQSKL